MADWVKFTATKQPSNKPPPPPPQPKPTKPPYVYVPEREDGKFNVGPRCAEAMMVFVFDGSGEEDWRVWNARGPCKLDQLPWLTEVIPTDPDTEGPHIESEYQLPLLKSRHVWQEGMTYLDLLNVERDMHAYHLRLENGGFDKEWLRKGYYTIHQQIIRAYPKNWIDWLCHLAADPVDPFPATYEVLGLGEMQEPVDQCWRSRGEEGRARTLEQWTPAAKQQVIDGMVNVIEMEELIFGGGMSGTMSYFKRKFEELPTERHTDDNAGGDAAVDADVNANAAITRESDVGDDDFMLPSDEGEFDVDMADAGEQEVEGRVNDG